MKSQRAVPDLIAEIEKTIKILKANYHFYKEFKTGDLSVLGRRTSAAMILSQIFTDFYTSVETVFLRISQFFENSLQKDEWHKQLLHKMTLDIKGVRKAVISDDTFSVMDEILRFRHFRRYYFEMEYDWDRIDMVEKKYIQAHELLYKDLGEFTRFLRKLI
jgi:hypothetical protein